MHEQQKSQFNRLDRLSKKLNDLCDELNLTNLKINTDNKIGTQNNSTNNNINNKNENTKQKQIQQQLECQLNSSSTQQQQQQQQQQTGSLLSNRAKFNLNVNLDSLKNLKRVSTKINVILNYN